MIPILVGSDSVLKFDATQQAIDLIGLDSDTIGLKVESGVPNQPIGKEQTLLGAMNRALAARKINPSAYAVGIESGLIRICTDICDITFVHVITPSGRRILRKSVGVVVPPELVSLSLASNQVRTAGAFEADRSASDPSNPHPIWSKGKIDRLRLLTTVLYSALFAATIHEEGEFS